MKMNIAAIRKEVAAVCDRKIARLEKANNGPASNKAKREIHYLQDLKYRWIDSSWLARYQARIQAIMTNGWS